MADMPAKMARTRDRFAGMDRTQRIQVLIDLGKKFKPIPESIAARPFPEERKVPGCESGAYVWAEDDADSIKFHFAVENPQGISAMATAVLIDRNLSGAPLEEIAAVPPDIIYEIFGNELSMGKNLGLTNMLAMCQHEAKVRLRRA